MYKCVHTWIGFMYLKYILTMSEIVGMDATQRIFHTILKEWSRLTVGGVHRSRKTL